MTRRVPQLLALTNMLLAAGLFIAGQRHARSSIGSPGPAETQLAYWLNAPAAFVWKHLTHAFNRIMMYLDVDVAPTIGFVVYVSCFLVLSGFLWYVVGTYASEKKRRSDSVETIWAFRVLTGSLFVIIGCGIGLTGFADRTAPHFSASEPTVWGVAHDLLYLFWVLVCFWIG
jgi:hypothetical protein